MIQNTSLNSKISTWSELPSPWSKVHSLWSGIMVCSLCSMVFFSCTTQKQLTYLQDIDQAGQENFFPLDRPGYQIQNQDILYIKFFTLNTEINDMLNGGSQQYSQQMYTQESSTFVNGYNVSDSGNITIPIIGDVKVAGKTVDGARQYIQEKSRDFLKDATVIVKLLSFKFSVLGEVKKPGSYKNYNNQLTVLEAISMAGDITDFGDRSRVLVIRPTKDGSKTYRIDLKKKDVLASEAYFLLPNDLVIVEPINSKVFQLNIPLISLLFTTISTTVLILNFIK
jgi:polysaccharide export outer membrane protein